MGSFILTHLVNGVGQGVCRTVQSCFPLGSGSTRKISVGNVVEGEGDGKPSQERGGIINVKIREMHPLDVLS